MALFRSPLIILFLSSWIVFGWSTKRIGKKNFIILGQMYNFSQFLNLNLIYTDMKRLLTPESMIKSKDWINFQNNLIYNWLKCVFIIFFELLCIASFFAAGQTADCSWRPAGSECSPMQIVVSVRFNVGSGVIRIKSWATSEQTPIGQGFSWSS